MRIAVLGATGHIGKNIVEGLLQGHDLFLYARNVTSLQEFLKNKKSENIVSVASLATFKEASTEFDGIVNCVGFGAPEFWESYPSLVCRLTEEYDNQCMDYLSSNRHCVYVFVSSGAVYGEDLKHPINQESIAGVSVNKMTAGDAYRIAKLNAEVKHRVRDADSIFDLRLFGFFSRLIDTSSKYLLAQVILCVRRHTTLVTNADDFVRDYVHPKDLSGLVDLCFHQRGLNGCLDAYSKSPIKKTEILEFFQREYGLQINYVGNPETSLTGKKPHYYSDYRKAGDLLGYVPKYSSLDTLRMESEYLLSL